MSVVRTKPFPGFPHATLAFLHKLSQNNEREWFQAHKSDYEQRVLEPSLDFICAMEKPLALLSSRLLCVPKRVGGSLMRIYRDTRFAHDKRPYKTNIGIHFRHDAFRDIHGPGFYFHVGLDECFAAGGIWHPEPPALEKIRQHIVDQPKAWASVRRALAKLPDGAFHGEAVKRVPRGFAADHPWVEDLKRKDFIVSRRFDESLLYAPELQDFVLETFDTLKPLMKFICTSQGIRF